MSQEKLTIRKHLNADALFTTIHTAFEQIPDPHPDEDTISLADARMSGCAMFSLKDPSLLAFDQRRNDNAKRKNLTTIYHLDNVPCDTHMREMLDGVAPDALSPVYATLFRQAQRGKILEPFVFLDDCYLLSCDGTPYFSSTTIHCPSCLEKRHSNTGDITYSHALFGAAIVHPDRRDVIPVCPEPIVTQDGETKNDCERNAATRFFARFRAAHPHLKVIVIEDGLSSNAPHIRDLLRQKMHFILGVKPGDHAFLFRQVDMAAVRGKTLDDEETRDGVTHVFRCLNGVTLNESNQDVVVNVIEYWEIQADDTVHSFAWVTDITITRENVFDLMRGGRARWKIENETFNTLKNQGYHFEHNYGHGTQYLSVIFALLMMLAFLVDQILHVPAASSRPYGRRRAAKRGCGSM